MKGLDTSYPITRQALADATRDVHLALHRDPLLSRLLDASLQIKEYHAALSAFAVFYGTVEAGRRSFGLWPDYSLKAECAALAQDLNTEELLHEMPDYVCHLQLLGGLYVAHGSAFGKRVFGKIVQSALPDHSHCFVRQSADLGLWRALLHTIEAQGAQKKTVTALQTGARQSFELMQALTRQYNPVSTQPGR